MNADVLARIRAEIRAGSERLYRCCVHCNRRDGVCVDAPNGDNTHIAPCDLGGRHPCPDCECDRCDGTKLAVTA